jgi:hypothetical protein
MKRGALQVKLRAPDDRGRDQAREVAAIPVIAASRWESQRVSHSADWYETRIFADSQECGSLKHVEVGIRAVVLYQVLNLKLCSKQNEAKIINDFKGRPRTLASPCGSSCK